MSTARVCDKANARHAATHKEEPGPPSVFLLVHWCAGERRGCGAQAQGKFIAGWRNLQQSYFSCALEAVTWARCLYLNHLPFAPRASERTPLL